MNIGITDPQTNTEHVVAWDGANPPTDNDIHEILGQIKQSEPPELSKEDLVKGAIANLIQGATMGTGGTISGLSNIAATPARKIASALDVAPEMPEQTIGEQFQSGREAFEKPQEEFQEAHPIISAGTQMAGGIVPAVITGGGSELTSSKPILAKIVKGMAEGAGYGAAYGAGSNSSKLTENLLKGENPEENAENAAVGALQGGGLGAILGGTAPIVTGIGGFVGEMVKSMVAPESAAVDVLTDMVSKDVSPTMFTPKTANPIGFQPEGAPVMASKEIPKFNQPVNEPMKGTGEVINAREAAPVAQETAPVINPDLIKQSIETNTPLITMADPDGSIHRLAMETKLNGTPEAQAILTKFARETMEQQPSQLVDAVNSVLGTKDHFQNLDEIQNAYREAAAPAYEKANAYGDLATKDPTITDFVNNEDQLQKAIKQAQSSAIGRDLKGLPDTDIRVLDAAKQVMDDDISGLKRNGANKEARALDGLRTDLLKKVDAIAPEYAQARQIAGDHLKMMEAQEMGAKVLRAETPQSLSRIIPEMSPAEQAAMKVGFRDELLKQIGQSANTARSNVALKVFKETENSLARQNMKLILGKDYEPLMAKVDPLVKSGRNISDLMEGSQTAEKEKISERGMTLSHIIKHGILNAVKEQTNQKSTDIAKMLTGPSYLRQMLGKYK